MNALNKLMENCNKYKYKRKRDKYIKKVTGNIGNIVEDNDKITCYVTQELLDKNSKKSLYNIHCYGINTNA